MGHTLEELQAHVAQLAHRLETEDRDGRDYHHIVSAYSLALSYYRHRLQLGR
jgi:hypothetical protein